MYDAITTYTPQVSTAGGTIRAARNPQSHASDQIALDHSQALTSRVEFYALPPAFIGAQNGKCRGANCHSVYDKTPSVSHATNQGVREPRMQGLVQLAEESQSPSSIHSSAARYEFRSSAKLSPKRGDRINGQVSSATRSRENMHGNIAGHVRTWKNHIFGAPRSTERLAYQRNVWDDMSDSEEYSGENSEPFSGKEPDSVIFRDYPGQTSISRNMSHTQFRKDSRDIISTGEYPVQQSISPWDYPVNQFLMEMSPRERGKVEKSAFDWYETFKSQSKTMRVEPCPADFFGPTFFADMPKQKPKALRVSRGVARNIRIR
jgi:hypothetical protein